MADIRDTMMEKLLEEASVGDGMRVLDVGCGRGDVSLMIARRVGDRGHVLGIDQDTGTLTTARERTSELGLCNLTFMEADLNTISPDQGVFDAVVGRRVLMYQPDTAHTVRQLANVLRSDGLIVFQEHDATMTPGRIIPLPLHEQVNEWIWRTVEREGADIHIGFRLPSLFAQASFAQVQIRAEAVVQTPDTDYPFAAIIRGMLPRIVKYGVATEKELGVDILAERLVAEREKAQAVYVSDMVFSAWARKNDSRRLN